MYAGDVGQVSEEREIGVREVEQSREAEEMGRLGRWGT